MTGGIAPDVYVNAWWDWYLNVAKEPPKQLEILQDGLAKAVDIWSFALRAAAGEKLAPAEGDARFSGAAWSQWPFNLYAHSYRHYVDWWQKAWSNVPGLAPQSERQLDFVARNASETLSPAHYLATNPELLDTTRAEAGENLVRGFNNWLEDVQRTLEGKGPSGTEKFVIGREVAATPGKVVLRNELVELIQYAPATPSVYAEPILIVPAWIMKYYVLDLSPANSLVNYLVGQGHTVFMVSWKNPTAADRSLGMDDYLRLGVRAALDAAAAIVPGRTIHAVGYCIGGTLLSIAAAVLAAEGDQRLASVTLLAAQQDFSEPGELSVFISPSQLDMLEAAMSRTGVLKSEQMGAAFALLRSRDLLWAPAVNTYLRGKRDSPNDLMAWNADGVPHARRVFAPAVSQQRTCARRVRVGRAARRSRRHSGCDVRGRHGDRSRRTLAVGVQGARAHALPGLHLSAHLRRAQRGNRERSHASAAPASRAHLVECHRDAHAASVARDDASSGRVLVAGVGSLAGGAFHGRARGAARARRPGIPADHRCTRRVRAAQMTRGSASRGPTSAPSSGGAPRSAA